MMADVEVKSDGSRQPPQNIDWFNVSWRPSKFTPGNLFFVSDVIFDGFVE